MAEKSSASNESTVKNIILKSDEVKKGFPSVYKLRTKVKDNNKHVRRVTFGKKDGKKIKNKTILLVGETGAGKSTLVNFMVNHAIGVKFEDGVWFQITEEEEGEKSQTESQTLYVTVYEIFGFEGKTLPFSLTIIDTPGFGNTQKIEQDLFVSQGLFDLFRSDDGVHEVDAVGLVMKASDNRMSDRLLYIFDSVMSLFGNDIIKNIIVMITHSNGLSPPGPLEALRVLEIKCARNEKNEPLHFLFDNCQDKERTDETKEILYNCDKISRKGIKGLSIFLETPNLNSWR
ncbi:uncharacterized protein LOC103460426 [Poecilia reticulata]|uniref:uncharacterized protein LOC103460426 n=1 Tax=Poecilia reticulata TaxID=8081 RepID=UPI0004A3A072|nr:PREDICTED: uncharacterized protein LOC103460426 [Poecilia reticulata]